MKFSFYRNLTWIIGILVAVEVLLKMGLKSGLVLLIADLVVVLILTYLFHRLNVTETSEPAADQATPGAAVEDSRTESKWQREHDQWWKRHQQLRSTGTVDDTTDPTKRSDGNNVDQLEHSNQKLRDQINYLNRQIILLRNDHGSSNKSSYKNSGWYQQITRLKRQIARLKSEYK